MAYSQDVRDKVRGSYVYERLPLEQAATKNGVPYNTVRAWKRKASKKGDDWDRARNAARIAQGNLGDITVAVIEDFVLLFQSTIESVKKDKDMSALNKAEMVARLSDAYVKTMKAAGGGDSKMGKLAIGLEILGMLSEFIRRHYPELIEPFTIMLEPFGAHMAQELDG